MRTEGTAFNLLSRPLQNNDRYPVYGEALLKPRFNDTYSVGGTAGFYMK